MDDFLKMDIFFVVATLATIILTAFAALALFHAVRVMKGMDRILGEIEEETRALRADIGSVREAARTEGAKLSGMFEAFHATLLGLLGKKPRKRKKAVKKEVSS